LQGEEGLQPQAAGQEGGRSGKSAVRTASQASGLPPHATIPRRAA